MLDIQCTKKKMASFDPKTELDTREKMCINFIKKGRYEELEKLLGKLHADREWRNKRPLPFQYLLEQALQKKDKKAVEVILPFMKIISPVSLTTKKLITKEPVLFRQLIESRKLDWSPNNKIRIYLENELGEVNLFNEKENFFPESYFSGTLLEVLIVSQDTECVKILLESGYPLKKEEYRARSFFQDDSGVFYGISTDWCFFTDATFQRTPLFLAIQTKNKEMVKMLMKVKEMRKNFYLDMLDLRYGDPVENWEFQKWFLEEYTNFVMKAFSLHWFMHHTLEEDVGMELLRKYKQKKGMKGVLKEWSQMADNMLMELDPDPFWGSGFPGGERTCLSGHYQRTGRKPGR